MTDAPVPDAPSPKLQLKVYGGAPPVVVAVKETGRFTRRVEGETVKLVASGGGVDDPKISVMGKAAASLAVIVGKAQLFSIR